MKKKQIKQQAMEMARMYLEKGSIFGGRSATMALDEAIFALNDDNLGAAIMFTNEAHERCLDALSYLHQALGAYQQKLRKERPKKKKSRRNK